MTRIGSLKSSSQKRPPSFGSRAFSYEEEDLPFEDSYQDFDDEPREEFFDHGRVHQLSTPRKTGNLSGRPRAKIPLSHLRRRLSPLRTHLSRTTLQWRKALCMATVLMAMIMMRNSRSEYSCRDLVVTWFSKTERNQIRNPLC